jgi:hypothetical protein
VLALLWQSGHHQGAMDLRAGSPAAERRTWFALADEGLYIRYRQISEDFGQHAQDCISGTNSP